MGFFPERGAIWLDGDLLPWSDARVHVCVHGLHYGTGVFEGIRFYDTARGPALFRLGEHLQRFERSAAQYRMQLGWSEEQLAQAVRDVIESSELTEGYVRPLALYGYGNLGILPRQCPVTVAIVVYPFPMYLGADGIQNGIRVTVSPWRKTHTSSVPSTAKGCGQYLNSFLSLSDARARGFEEALLLNQEGFVAEGSGENVFYVKDGTLLTNDAPASILPGITQASVLELARLHGIPSRIQTWIRLEDVLEADEAFFTGTAAEVTPIREVDGRSIGDGTVGAVTRRLQDSFFAAARGEAHADLGWLTFLKERGGNGMDGRRVLRPRSHEAGVQSTGRT
ncbi:MAG: branched-chain-amino-acid transaminase [Gemmatimonadetes bacterium]|nr:branched-chain-amino-acid transaminase [Gemmatimonadota bacterium]